MHRTFAPFAEAEPALLLVFCTYLAWRRSFLSALVYTVGSREREKIVVSFRGVGQTRNRFYNMLKKVPEDALLRVLAWLVVGDLFTFGTLSWTGVKAMRRVLHVDSGAVPIGPHRLRLVQALFPSCVALRLPLGEGVSIEALGACLLALPRLASLEIHGVKWRGTPRGSKLSVIHPPRPLTVDLFPPSNKLRSLRVTGTVFLGSDDLRGLCAGPELQVLELRGLRHLDDAGLEVLLSEASTPGFRDRLERLLLSDCTRLVNLDFPCRGLAELELRHCVGLAGFARELPSLLRVDLEFATGLGDDGVEDLLRLAPNLRDLCLRGCSSLRAPRLHSASMTRLDCSLCSGLVFPSVRAC